MHTLPSKFPAIIVAFARQFNLALPRKESANRRLRRVGTRRRSLLQVVTNFNTVWQRLKFLNWYRETNCLIEITTGTAVWYHGDLPPLPIRRVLVCDAKDEFKRRAI